ncbi:MULTISPECIES: phosphoribosylglycinamide formyltransferase [Clostridioides]|uniref:phosphoribosylglycinamide formyltransferase n=1 Tax=unclassified Clostridioides TaxID=2635829 RepID=UPI001D0C262B|nr:phosphoribosylglycinamide formyltransferase [Clostridioides sp. ZZV15-6388]MCC0637113.1 phosphoribosylglycinamide formyltransferase [Clostridioides sp. ES-S-0001-02]MCC0641129.1 phosphoribosylglycinamide formyltransferase [Clostridioides sp. ES-S-0049-03]MCC0644175.1 phosphoribosylglycinamide formyltransferase [Clostridioides sp. ZZV14-6150]MCC0654171.1 phosphoribosylglycinamide formyltransferase [Clostridioides sp. ES-S-0001-03]MCC0657935.1 phosphoribosylglycinamide formyltransferase [Clos
MLNIGVLISGGGTNLQAVIDGTESGKIKGQVKVVISSKQDAYGLERAKNHNIKAICETNEDKIIEILKENKIDLVVLAGYLKIISPKLVNEFRNKMINIHPSLIPSFCGAGFYGERVHQGVIDYGAKVTGATVHFVDEGADTGPIIMQDVVKVNQDDDAKTLAKRVLEVEHRILEESLSLFCENKLKLQGRRVFINE